MNILADDTVADPAAGLGGAEKHEIYAAVFNSHLFMTYFYMTRGAMAPSAPPGSATVTYNFFKPF